MAKPTSTMDRRRAAAVGISNEMLESVHDEQRLRNALLSNLIRIKVDDLVPDPDQPRKYFDAEDLAAVAATIARHGLQEPLIVYKAKPTDTKWTIKDGERRWRAAHVMLADREMKKSDFALSYAREGVPVIIRHGIGGAPGADRHQIVVEQMLTQQKRHFTPLEEAAGLMYLAGEKRSAPDVAEEVGYDAKKAERLLKIGRDLTARERGFIADKWPTAPMTTLVRLCEWLAEHKDNMDAQGRASAIAHFAEKQLTAEMVKRGALRSYLVRKRGAGRRAASRMKVGFTPQTGFRATIVIPPTRLDARTLERAQVQARAALATIEDLIKKQRKTAAEPE